MENEKLTINLYKDLTLTINTKQVDLYNGIKFSYTIKSDEQFITSSSANGYFFSTRGKAIEHANDFIDENFE